MLFSQTPTIHLIILFFFWLLFFSLHSLVSMEEKHKRMLYETVEIKTIFSDVSSSVRHIYKAYCSLFVSLYRQIRYHCCVACNPYYWNFHHSIDIV